MTAKATEMMTAQTTWSPDSSSTIPEATTNDGETSPTYVRPADWATTTRVATAVGIAAPTHWAKKAATPAPVSHVRTRPTTVAVRKLIRMMNGPAPTSPAAPAASAPPATVTSQRR